MDHTRRFSLSVCLLIGLLITAASCGDSSPSEPGEGGNASPSVSITAPADGATLQAGEISLSGTASDAEDGNLSAAIEWISGSDLLGTGSNVSTSLAEGSHDITASVSDSDGASASASVSVTVVEPPNEAPTVSISQPADATSVSEGTEITFTGSASDPEDGDLSEEIAWSSDLDGDLGMGASIQAMLSVGTHTVTAAVSDSDGQVISTAVSIEVISSGAVPSNLVVVANEDSDDLTVIDLTARAVVATIPLSGPPTGLGFALDSDGRFAFVSASGGIDVVDLRARSVTGSLAHAPYTVVASPIGGIAYACCDFVDGAYSMAVIDLTSRTISSFEGRPSGGASPVFAPDGLRAYLPEFAFVGQDTIQVVDTETHEVIEKINALGPSYTVPEGAISIDGEIGYFTQNFQSSSESSSEIAVVDLVAGVSTHTIPTSDGGLWDIAVHPDGTTLWVSEWVGVGSRLSIIDTNSNSVIDTIDIGNTFAPDIVFSADGSELYAVRYNLDDMIIVDTSTRSIAGTVPVGVKPLMIAVPLGAP